MYSEAEMTRHANWGYLVPASMENDINRRSSCKQGL